MTTNLKQTEIETKKLIRIMKPLIPNGYTLTYKLYLPKTIDLIIVEDSTNITVADSNVTYENSYGSVKEAFINTISSTIGNKTGTFLLYLHTYLLIKQNITNVTLNNATNDPARAASGIYKMFNVDMRQQNRSKAIGASLHNRLIISGGYMRLRVTNMNTWNEYFNDLVESFNTQHTFKWNKSKLEEISNILKQNYPYTSISRKTSLNTGFKNKINRRSKTKKNSNKKRKNQVEKYRSLKTKKSIN